MDYDLDIPVSLHILTLGTIPYDGGEPFWLINSRKLHHNTSVWPADEVLLTVSALKLVLGVFQ